MMSIRAEIREDFKAFRHRLRGPSTIKGYLIASCVFVILLYALLINQVNHSRQGCERLDQVRVVEYRVLQDAIPSIDEQAKAAVARGQMQEAAALHLRSDQYDEYLTDLAVPLGYLSDDPENSADIDCSKAYPMPEPINWFE